MPCGKIKLNSSASIEDQIMARCSHIDLPSLALYLYEYTLCTEKGIPLSRHKLRQIRRRDLEDIVNAHQYVLHKQRALQFAEYEENVYQFGEPNYQAY